MKTFHVGLAVVAVISLAGLSQLGSQADAGMPPGTGAGQPYPGMTTNNSQLTFNKLSVNDTFYFQSDTKKAFPWTKLSDSTAMNTINSNKASIGLFVPVVK